MLRTVGGAAAEVVGTGIGAVASSCCCCFLGGVSVIIEDLNCGCATGIRRDEIGVDGVISVGRVEEGQLGTRKRVLDV